MASSEATAQTVAPQGRPDQEHQMTITFCIEAHSPTEDEALRSEDAPELNVHNSGGYR